MRHKCVELTALMGLLGSVSGVSPGAAVSRTVDSHAAMELISAFCLNMGYVWLLCIFHSKQKKLKGRKRKSN